MGKSSPALHWIAILALALGAGACQKAKSEAPQGVQWIHSVDAALADAKSTGRPILLDMYTDWCEWCHALDDTTYVDSAFIAYSRKFTMARVNAEVDTVNAAKYSVKSYPTVLILHPDGTEIDRVVGYSRAPEFIAEIEDYLAGKNTIAALEAEAAARGTDPAVVARLADKYFGHGLYEQARTQYLKLAELDPKNTTGQVDDGLYSVARMYRKDKDYANARKYAKIIIDRYPTSDMYRPALLEFAGAWRRQGELATARGLYLDYAKRFPDDGDAPFAREQADTLAAKLAAMKGKGA
jgi:thioredoxin-like negative regulator of GroEL